MRSLPRFASLFAVAVAAVPAQEVDAVPTEHVRAIPPGAFVDLDGGILLPGRERKPLQADLGFDRDGRGFFLQPWFGAVAAAANDTVPGGEWTNERQRLGRRETTPTTWFVRTDRGGIARVTLTVCDPYATASAVLRWVVAPPGNATFLAAPQDVRTAWRGKALEVTWSAPEPRFLVEVDSNGNTQKLTVDAPPLRLEGLAPDGVHRVRVRGLAPDGTVTLPADVVQHGRKRPAVRGAVGYADRWYDTTGGFSLQRGEAAFDDAEVVFYLYGVYVPGGGVQKVGRGATAYRELTSIPESGYLPMYDRLDDHDVLAVRTADGRYAKLWLEPVKGSDVRSGMRVNFAFLADGRRDLLGSPASVEARRTAAEWQLHWPLVSGARAYRIALAGGAPIEVVSSPAAVPGLAPDRVYEVEITALGEDGEVSDPLAAGVHTYGDGYRVGSVRLESQHDGYGFAADGPVKDDGAPVGLDLRFNGGAGNYNVMYFDTPHGSAAGAPLAFGEFPAAGAELRFEQRWSCDDRKPGTEAFLVRTGDGGIASVRVRTWGSPAVLDYVWKKPAR